MLIGNSNSAASTAQANVGLTAFQIAVVQAKVFKKTLEEVTDRADQTARELERQAVEEQKRVRERLAKERGGVDVVVDGTDSAKSDSAKNADAPKQADAPAKVGGVDITV
jgi:hypothetical protein